MSLLPRERLGHYEILAMIGKGGMGEVYRARDTRLDRDAAIKVLPAALAGHPDRLARFEREAKVLAALNHPNIAVIYGLEDSGGGVRGIAMELVDGPTLADRIAAGSIPYAEALKIARQIGEALGAAHERGVVHRDLKPANIKVMPEGLVKVLDFGLATAVQGGERDSLDPANSPTLTMGATEAGLILGTAAYMSPEQASGKKVDKRADIWSFGVVFYEMLIGRRMFEGETMSHTLAAVLTQEPQLDRVPFEVRRLVRACLEKDEKNRLRDIGDAWRLIEEQPEPATKHEPARRRWLWPAISAVLAVAAAGSLASVLLQPKPEPRVMRFEIQPPPGGKLPFGTPAISPDGRTLVYAVVEKDGVLRLHMRPIDSVQTRVLPGTENAIHPFFSPDGKSVAFASGGKLKRVDLAGGTPRALGDVTGPWHGSWGATGSLLLMSGGLRRMDSSGGAATDVSQELTFPFFLSDGRRFLTRAASGDRSDIDLYSLDSKEHKRVLDNVFSAPILAHTPTGKTYLLYVRDTVLLAQEFDEGSAAVRGEEEVIVDNIGRVASPAFMPTAGVSDAGILAYQTGGTYTTGAQMVWYGRDGKRLKTLPAEASGEDPAISPDGKSVAVRRPDQTNGVRQIWVIDLARGAATRLTFGRGAGLPLWTPDGKRIIYTWASTVYERDASGVGEERVLLEGKNLVARSVSSDGKYLLYTEANTLSLLPLTGEKKPIRVGSPGSQTARVTGSAISPDSRFIAYVSDESGQNQVFVQPMPPGAGKWQISVDGGNTPEWRRDGKELYFAAGQRLMAADVKLGDSFSAGTPRELFSIMSPVQGIQYSPAADGQSFLVNLPLAESPDAPLTVVVNWWAALKK